MPDQPPDPDKQLSEELRGRYGHPAEYYGYQWTEPRDEVSLFDIWEALVRRRWIVLGVTVVVTVLATGYAASRSEQFRYSQVVDIGTWIADGKMQTIESANSVAAKMEESFIPAAVRSWMEKNTEDAWTPKIDISARNDADIVVLSAEGTSAQAGAISSVMNEATSALQTDHDQMFLAIRDQLRLDIARAETELGTLNKDVEGAKHQLKRTNDREALLQEEISELREALAEARNRRNEAIGNNNDGNAIALMLLNDEIQATRRRINELRHDQRIGLPKERDEYKRLLTGLQREIAEQRAELRAAKSSLENLAQTRVMSEPARSIESVGTSGAVIVSFGLILGCVAGIFASFVAEFLAAARRRRQQGVGVDLQEG